MTTGAGRDTAKPCSGVFRNEANELHEHSNETQQPHYIEASDICITAKMLTIVQK